MSNKNLEENRFENHDSQKEVTSSVNIDEPDAKQSKTRHAT